MQPEHDAAPGAGIPRANINCHGKASNVSSVRCDSDSGGPCDFCGGAKSSHQYGCESFAPSINGLANIRVPMIGDWFACRLCHGFIEKDAWAHLHRRVMAAHRKRYTRLYGPPTAAEVAAMAEQLLVVWYGFRAHRTGPAVRIGGAS
ncbi:hypothetical protein [Streptomyces sp. NPDC059063]|uniref:hypothetical protein n=1 Tax=unclassified Streptomyces TaxID=2593676 RepID=UPI00369B3FB4